MNLLFTLAMLAGFAGMSSPAANVEAAVCCSCACCATDCDSCCGDDCGTCCSDDGCGKDCCDTAVAPACSGGC